MSSKIFWTQLHEDLDALKPLIIRGKVPVFVSIHYRPEVRQTSCETDLDSDSSPASTRSEPEDFDFLTLVPRATYTCQLVASLLPLYSQWALAEPLDTSKLNFKATFEGLELPMSDLVLGSIYDFLISATDYVVTDLGPSPPSAPLRVKVTIVDSEEQIDSLEAQISNLARLCLHSYKLAASLWSQKSFNEIQKMSRHQQLAFYEVFTRGKVLGPLRSPSSFDCLEEFRAIYFDNLFTAGLPGRPERKDSGTRPNPEPKEEPHSLMSDMASWGIKVASRVVPSLAHKMNPAPKKPTMVLKVSPFKPLSLESTRILVNIHVWGPPYLRRLLAKPLREDQQLTTMSDLIRDAFPPELAEWILSTMEARLLGDAHDDRECFVKIEGINVHPDATLVWWYVHSMTWKCALEISVRLPANLVM